MQKTLKKPAQCSPVPGPVDFPSNVTLSRCVRFAAPLHSKPSEVAGGRNSFAGFPSMFGLALACEIVVEVTGKPDPLTGYLINITEIDKAVRSCVVPMVDAAVRSGALAEPAALLKRALIATRTEIEGAAGGRQGAGRVKVQSMRWNLSRYYSLSMSAAASDRVLITQSFEFAAAHRLHCASLDDSTNREIFGKCNNASGHGHNYRVEVTVEAPLDSHDSHAFTLQRLESIVEERVVQRFDHKHLNKDTDEFAALNPSVENITRICYGLLAPFVADAGGRLQRVTVWETEKTSCSYPA